MFIKKIWLVIFMITGITVNLMAQTKNDYAKNWKKVEAFEKKGLTKSALQEVLAIYNLAIKENNDAQQIKASMYQIKYRNMVEEDSQENNIFFVDTLIEKAKAPAKNILQSMYAEMFWQYLQNNRWKFYNRTKLAQEKSKDITTWSINKLYATISKLYKASLQNEPLLKNTKLDGLDAILIKGENTRQLRPTLYDFLAHRAIEFFTNDENDIIKPAYQFKIDDAAAFTKAADFINASFKTKDTASLQQKALLLFQDILKFHLADANADALIDADLIRLNFVHTNAVLENKEKLYEEALLAIEQKYPANPAVAQAMYLRGNIYLSRGQQYEALTKTENQYEIKRAKELFESAYARFPKSEGGINAKNAVMQIEQPSLNIETDQVNVPMQPFRSLVKYKNIKTLYLRVIKTTREELKNLDRREYEKLWKAYTEMKPVKSWSINLPDLQDYQEHSTEIKIDGLPNGTYLVLAGIDPGFALTKNIIAKQQTYVSNISYIHTSTNEYYVLDRDNGQPLGNATVQIWESKYDYNTSKYEEVKHEKYTTDKNGYFKLKDSKDNYRNFMVQVINGADELFLDENHSSYVYNNYVPEYKPQTFLFTDRSIYRPGQLLYFKGLVVSKEKDASKTAVIPGFKTTIQLKDANGQKSAELTVTTNEFGSYKGSFKLPEGVMNGNFSLFDTATKSYISFSVEEYKRPKFFTEIQKPKGTYRINDSVEVTGTAKAYAGNNIDGASVKYRVVRKVRYPVWWPVPMYSGGWGGKRYPSGGNEEMEITNGETKTDAKGEFKIKFKAIPDETVDKASQPTFYYEVSADITDINGETRSGNTSVAVAYQMLQLNINMPETLPVDSLKNLSISTTNLNDIFEKASVNVTITKVISPTKIYRERYWEMPDQFMMSKNEYEGYFPYDIYKDEDQQNKWPLGEKVLDKTDSTKENTSFLVSGFPFVAGWYKVVAVTKDKYGELVKAEKYIQLTGNNERIYDAVKLEVTKGNAEPGETINYNIKTGFDNVWLIHSLSKMDKTNNFSYKTVSNTQPAGFVQPVTEADRGGMAMSYAFVKHNRVYKGNQGFSIPWSNKDLQISYETFRDKLLPGAEEKWKIKITGNKGEKVAAEMLAGMYDASLDQFKAHSWYKPNVWPVLYNTIYWNINGFGKVNSDELNGADREYLTVPDKSYDRLLMSDYYEYDRYGGGRNMKIAQRSYAESGAPPPPPPPSPVAAGNVNEALAGKVAGIQVRGKSSVKLDNDKDGLLDIKDTISGATTKSNGSEVQIRKNFNETAFFFPDLKTDAEGNIEFSFTMSEALTQWKLMTLAHTKDMASAYSTKTVVTQKPLMVQPNAPRFMREGDNMEFSAKIVNLGEKEVTGVATLELLDAATNKPIDGWFKNVFPNQYFTVAPGQSQAVKFPMEIPFNFNSALTYRIKAVSKAPAAGGGLEGAEFSDGEEMAIPILTNRMLVTESMPLNMRGVSSKTFKFEKLLNSSPAGGGREGATLTNHALTVEYTSNPAWYAVQALPYLMEYPYECAEQTFNRYYANTLASYISRSMPKIKTVFEKWKTVDTAALLSNLQKNEELKSALLQETPWVLEAQNEAQQKKNIALLFDMVKMSAEQSKAFNKLKEMQSSNGGFTWFKGGADDRYMTQYITTGIGHLRKLEALTGDNYQSIKSVVDKAVPYLDKKIKEDYDDLIKYKAKLKENHLSYIAIQYLYMRSFFPEYKVAAASQTAYNYYTGQAKKYWLSNSKYMQAMIALALHRSNDATTPKAIIRSLKENSINKEELGMYWKEWTTGGYYWHQAPIESQAMMIEAFMDIDKNNTTVDDLKTWLLKQKQTQNWKTTKATAEACYALLLSPPAPQGGNKASVWLEQDNAVTITLGSTVINSTDDKTEAGTGYFKERIEGDKVKADMGYISVSTKSSDSKNPPMGGGGAWGSVYWQYFEDLDKITPAETPLKLVKKLFIEKNSPTGPVLVALEDGAQLKVGDKVKVRIELKVDRDMEYVHMKDMRAACMEPVNVLSSYKYQGGLGYYESTKDASTNFFFGWLNRGSYVFEYPMFVTHAGNFSNGITTIQCMYAPEFTSHSEGIRVIVE
ncbi:MAG: alpha-2-macroglobulin [Ferruginibacter sp.]|nr:alpha-2-macroglobulin [Ferruginibacter sp.]